MSKKINKYEWFVGIIAAIGLPYIIIQTSESIEKWFGIDFYHSFTAFIIVIVLILLWFGKQVIFKFLIKISTMFKSAYSKMRTIIFTTYMVIRNIPLIAKLDKLDQISKKNRRTKR